MIKKKSDNFAPLAICYVGYVDRVLEYTKMVLLTISEVNSLDYEDFILHFGNIVEHCSICAAAVWKNRPFQNIGQLHADICKFMDQLPDAGRFIGFSFINQFIHLIIT